MNNGDLTGWLTLAMAAFTGWMAWETRRMAKAAFASVEVASMPQLALTDVQLVQGNSIDPKGGPDYLGVQIKLQFRNAGHVRVCYDLQRAEVEFQGTKAPLGSYDNHVGVIPPGGDAGFYFSSVPIASPLVFKDMFMLNVRANFWATADRRESLTFALRIVILSPDPLRWHWVFTNGPTYS